MRVFVAVAVAIVVASTAVGCRHSVSDTLAGCKETRLALRMRVPKAARGPLVAVTQTRPDAPAMLARVDPISLRPLSPAIEVGEYHRAWSISPGGGAVALGVSAGGSSLDPSKRLRARVGVYIVELEAMKLTRELQTGVAAVAVGWLAPRRLVASLQRGGTVLVDPRTGRIIRRWSAFSFADVSARTRDGLVLLVPPLRGDAKAPLVRASGPARLVVVDRAGRLRSVTLDRVRLAVRTVNGVTYEDRAGLAVDPARGRAYVVAAEAPIAEVDLATMDVSYHFELPAARTDDRLRAPARQRQALWLGDGQLAVAGHDLRAAGADPFAATPAGVVVIDTGDWTACILDKEAGGVVVTGGRLLTYAGTRSSARNAKRGIDAYGRRRALTWSVARDEQVWDVDVGARHAYIQTARAVHVVDKSSGKLVATVPRPLEIVSVIDPSR